MPNLSDKTVDPVVRTLLLGDSGSGKTGALASLAAAGYNLYIADFDNGLDIIVNLLRRNDPESLKFIDYGTFRDRYQIVGDRLVPLSADAWRLGIQYIEKCSKIQSLSGDDIIVIDSLSFAAKASLNHILKLNGRLSIPAHQSDWYEAQKLTEGLVALMTDPAIPCNVIMTAHIAYQGNEEAGEQIRGFPSSVGKALNPVLNRYFNHVLMCRQMGSGGAVTRRIHTNTMGNVELKTSNPGVVKDNYPLVTGLADYFKDARGTVPGEAA